MYLYNARFLYNFSKYFAVFSNIYNETKIKEDKVTKIVGTNILAILSILLTLPNAHAH